MTSEGSIGPVRDQKDRKEKEAKELEQRRVARVDQKAAKAALQEEWKEIMKKHNEAVEGWVGECNRLRAEGVRAKDLPKKPKCPLKPKLLAEEQEDNEERSSLSSSEDEG